MPSSHKRARRFARHAVSALTVLAPAKLNLFLEVFFRRSDGYHEIVSVMETVSLYDRLRFWPAARGGIELRVTGRKVPEGPENLVFRAAEEVRRKAGVRDGLRIELDKRIPAGSGLGGGSSDAAATLRALRSLWRLPWPDEELEALAASLGSDVPFFLSGGRALVRGRGETVEPLESKHRLYYAVLYPGFSVSTREVYLKGKIALTAPRADPTLLLHFLDRGDLEAAGSALGNRLEESLFELYAVLGKRKEALAAENGVLAVQATGSGSALFALCRSAAAARRLAVRWSRRGWGEAFAVHSVALSEVEESRVAGARR